MGLAEEAAAAKEREAERQRAQEVSRESYRRWWETEVNALVKEAAPLVKEKLPRKIFSRSCWWLSLPFESDVEYTSYMTIGVYPDGTWTWASKENRFRLDPVYSKASQPEFEFPLDTDRKRVARALRECFVRFVS